MAVLPLKHFFVLLLVFTGLMVMQQAEADICNNILKPLPGSGGKCVVRACEKLCNLLYKGSAECVESGTRCMCVWEC
ncbi:putative defensin-like protein 160 isoform X2 [Hevea brasiliensis]|uniref:putative defensin-like protein 160 isoform X2 n=1 Tax=Hevea brasiliensis TaxID=3981 RepID=UPI000B76EABD|nr:putative defensin-like protein 160 isoform X2 [Hevea brasiliensis]